MAITKENSQDSLDFEDSYVTIPRPSDTNTTNAVEPVLTAAPTDHVIHSSRSSDAQDGTQESPPPTISPSKMNATEASFANNNARPNSDTVEQLHRDHQQQHEDRARLIGAGVVAAVITLPILGPTLATVAGVAAAYGSTKSGAAGDAYRAAGDIAMNAKDKVKEINEKHDIVNQTKNGAQGILSKLKDVDGRHDLLETVKCFLANTAKGLSEAFKSISEKINKWDQQRSESTGTK